MELNCNRFNICSLTPCYMYKDDFESCVIIYVSCLCFLQNTKLNQHLFWVAVGILQLGESTLYAAGLGLMEACIKVLTNIDAFEEQVRSK